MSIVDNFSRIMSEEAGKVLRIAGKGPGDVERAFERLGQAGGAVGGGVFGGGLGGVLGAGLGGWAAGQVHDLIFGDSSQQRRTKMGKQARHCIGRLAHVLGSEIVAEMRRKGLGAAFDEIAGNAPIARFSDYLGEDLTQLRGMPRGKGQAAAKVYMDSAAPARLVGPPDELYEAESWFLLAGVWSPFGDIAARFAAVADAIDMGGLPDHASGRAAMRQAYPREWAKVESAGQIFGSTGGSTQRLGRTPKRVLNPKQKRVTVSRKNKRSGGGALIGGTIAVSLISAGVAAAARKRGRR